MLDNKKIKEAEARVKGYIRDGIIKSKQQPKDINFFLTNANQSLTASKLLMDVSTKTDIQKATGYLKFNGFLWVINSSYYSIFYTARALLESAGIKINSHISIHLKTFDALIYYFYINEKLQKEIIVAYAESLEEADELLGQEKADNLIETYYQEKEKRSKFTYEIGELAMQSKARTSLQRANNFNREIRKIIK